MKQDMDGTHYRSSTHVLKVPKPQFPCLLEVINPSLLESYDKSIKQHRETTWKSKPQSTPFPPALFVKVKTEAQRGQRSQSLGSGYTEMEGWKPTSVPSFLPIPFSPKQTPQPHGLPTQKGDEGLVGCR